MRIFQGLNGKAVNLTVHEGSGLLVTSKPLLQAFLVTRTQDPNHPKRLRGQSRHRPLKTFVAFLQ